MTDQDAFEYLKMEQSSLYFVRQTWGLVPQPVKEKYKARFALGLMLRDKAWDKFCDGITPDWFEEYREGLHLTWQQSLVFYGIDKAIRGECSMRISIVSGHGIGKSMMLSILILWFLFVHPDSQVACTSPGKEQMYDVLWKELKKWIDKMPEEMAQMYEWESSHIRMKESAQTWFARAKTASKENTEALAGVHADWVMIAVDEASGVEEPIFETMEGALTSGNILVFLISNGTRSIGYFYDTHHKNDARWQNYAFSSLDSPRVDQKYVDSIVAQYGSDSVQYTIRVLGGFPDEGIMDDKGYVQLFNEADLHFVPFNADWNPVGRVIGALDASGEGQDKSEWAVRDRMRAAIVAEEETSNSAGMAIKSITVCDKYEIDPIDFIIDNFGKGADVGMEIALATSKQKRPWRVNPTNVGDQCEDDLDRVLYINKRAEMFYKFMKWCRAGSELMESPRLREQLLSIRFRRTANGRIQIMDKVTMKKLGFPSPDKADAIAMTFLRRDNLEKRSILGEREADRARQTEFDPHATME
jgi:phage terminase large subunit